MRTLLQASSNRSTTFINNPPNQICLDRPLAMKKEGVQTRKRKPRNADGPSSRPRRSHHNNAHKNSVHESNQHAYVRVEANGSGTLVRIYVT